jgi:hypothetical protein
MKTLRIFTPGNPLADVENIHWHRSQAYRQFHFGAMAASDFGSWARGGYRVLRCNLSAFDVHRFYEAGILSRIRVGE